IVIGCVIKVFVQVELGRQAIASARGTMASLAEVPGPTLAISVTGRPGSMVAAGNWLIWYYLIMLAFSLGQLGGIVGGVGQALAISMPITESGRAYNREVEDRTRRVIEKHELGMAGGVQVELDALDRRIRQHATKIEGMRDQVADHKMWATLVALVTSILLVAGRYRLIQAASAIFVAIFTLVTMVNLLLLQGNATYAVTLSELIDGIRFRLPPRGDLPGMNPVAVALATFGIIGVGAGELIAYPYWCLEKGYARATGRPDGTREWAERARGWLRVMRWDAWCSMFVYTFATVAFYLLGAAILGRIHLVPSGTEMIRTLAIMYEPVFGSWAPPLFLFGAFAVLYSTFFVANAAHARVLSDTLSTLGIADRSEGAHQRRVRWLSGLLPFVCLTVYLGFPQPAKLVLASGVMQALMLPMLAAAALYFRYRRCDPRIAPGRVWDLLLWLSALGMLLAGAWLTWTLVAP
ncbi:MAG: Nramp family divalent metal transporter, partial [Pirellulales bacterium]